VGRGLWGKKGVKCRQLKGEGLQKKPDLGGNHLNRDKVSYITKGGVCLAGEPVSAIFPTSNAGNVTTGESGRRKKEGGGVGGGYQQGF